MRKRREKVPFASYIAMKETKEANDRVAFITKMDEVDAAREKKFNDFHENMPITKAKDYKVYGSRMA